MICFNAGMVKLADTGDLYIEPYIRNSIWDDFKIGESFNLVTPSQAF